MHFKGLILLLFLICTFSSLPGENNSTGQPEKIARLLRENGYENIRVCTRNDTLIVGLENRVWRWEPRGAANVFRLLMPEVDSVTVISLTLLREGIPLTTVIVSRRQYDRLLNGNLAVQDFQDSVVALISNDQYRLTAGKQKPGRPSYFKADFVVIPQLKAQFGNFVHPLEVQFNIAPAVNMTFYKGMSLTAQVIIPVFNNLIGDPEGNTIRPGLIVLSQSFRLPHDFFATMNAGYFTRNRYGVHGEVRKFCLNGKVSLMASMGYTGSMQVMEGKFTYTSANVFTWFADASWRIARYNLLLSAGYGRFLGLDYGWRADVSRQFGEVSIGFYAMRTGGLVNGGFNFIVPLPPRKYGTKNHVRIRPAPYVSWEYRARGLPSTGRMYSTGSGTGEFMFNMNPDYIRMQLGKSILNK